MVFSSVPVFQVLDPPNWQYQPPGGSVSDYKNDEGNNHHLRLPPMPPSYGLPNGPDSGAERPRLTKLPLEETAYKCPRCASTNTKFCYYNNYSLAQPRHFCKACRRYWTRGGALRNVPVGGGFRRNKRSKKIRSKSPVTGNSSSGVSSSSCTTNNILGHAAPSILPHFPLFPSINFTSHLGAEDINSFSFRGIHQYPTTTPGEYSDQGRLQKFPVAAELVEPLSGGVMHQLQSEVTSDYGFKPVDSCGPSQVELIKFEADQGFMSCLPKNPLGFPGNEHQEIWSSVNAWNEPNALNPASTGHLL